MNTNKKGDIGLVKTMLDLTLKGYFIFTPISDTTCVDLVISDDEMNLKRAQIKYCKLRKGKFEISTSTVVNGKRIPVDLNKLDIWIIYCPDNDTLYYVPVKDLIGCKTLGLRVIEPKIMSEQVNMASKYLNIEDAW
jgi:hypothetical protein